MLIKEIEVESLSNHSYLLVSQEAGLAAVIDPGTEFFELGTFAAFGMYADWGEAPCAGVVCGIGRVASRSFMVIANDASVKAGAFFPQTAKKVLEAKS